MSLVDQQVYVAFWIGQQSGHAVGFVLRQLPVNGGLAVPTHTDAFECGDGLEPSLKGGVHIQGKSLSSWFPSPTPPSVDTVGYRI